MFSKTCMFTIIHSNVYSFILCISYTQCDLLQHGFTTMAMERGELEIGALKMEQSAFKKFLPCTKHS